MATLGLDNERRELKRDDDDGSSKQTRAEEQE